MPRLVSRGQRRMKREEKEGGGGEKFLLSTYFVPSIILFSLPHNLTMLLLLFPFYR